jgi:hypothetical protein
MGMNGEQRTRSISKGYKKKIGDRVLQGCQNLFEETPARTYPVTVFQPAQLVCSNHSILFPCYHVKSERFLSLYTPSPFRSRRSPTFSYILSQFTKAQYDKLQEDQVSNSCDYSVIPEKV